MSAPEVWYSPSLDTSNGLILNESGYVDTWGEAIRALPADAVRLVDVSALLRRFDELEADPFAVVDFDELRELLGITEDR